MKKQIMISILGILMLVGASAMYSGESITFETNLTSPVYTVVGNSSDLLGLDVDFGNGNITITTDPLMASDNFTLIFFDETTKEVTNTVYSGGGSSGSGRITKYVDNNVTTYVPEYINNTKTIEVEKVVDNTTVLKTGYELWHLFLCMALGIGFGWYITKKSGDDGIKTN